MMTSEVAEGRAGEQVEPAEEAALKRHAGPANATSLSRNRRFQALWIGGATAYLGSSFITVAAPLLILGLTGSAAQAGCYGFIEAAASIAAGLPAGVILDRYNRRTLMIASDSVRALAFATAVVALLAGHLTMPHLFAVAAVTGAARPFAGSARSLATRAVVAPEQLTKALATEEVRTHTASIIGPSVAGVMFAVSRAFPFLGAAVGYLVSALCAFAAPSDTEATRTRRDTASGGTLDGIKILMRDPMFRVCLTALSLVNLGGVAIELVVVVLVREHGGSSSAVGGALALSALGGLAGAALVTPLHRLLRPGWLLIALMLWVAALNTALVVPLGAWWYGGVLAATMLGVPAAVVLLDVLIFRQVDDVVRGRTISSTMTILNVGLSLGPLAAGLLLQYAGATSAVLVFSAVIALAGLGALSSRAVRSAQWPGKATEAAAVAVGAGLAATDA